MHRTYICCLLMLLIMLAGYGQSKIRRELRADTGSLYLRFSPMGIIDPFDGNITFGGEYRLNDDWAVTLDAGAILYSAYFDRTRKTTGYLLRPGLRVYPTRRKDLFIDMQFHYKDVTYQIRNWLQKDVVNDVASYEEFKLFRYKKQVVGGHVTVGFKEYFGGSKRFFFEGYLGLGIHYKEEGVYNEPNSRYNVRLRMLNTMNGKYVVPALPGGMRIVYLIR